MANCKTRIGCVEIRFSYWVENNVICGTLEDYNRLEPDCYPGLICYATVLEDRRIKLEDCIGQEFSICVRDYPSGKLSAKEVKEFIAYSRKVAELFSSFIIGLSAYRIEDAQQVFDSASCLTFDQLFNLDYLNCVFVDNGKD